MSSPLIATLVAQVRKQISSEQEALSTVSFEKLYNVGKIQGRVEGLRLALAILDEVLQDQDN